MISEIEIDTKLPITKISQILKALVLINKIEFNETSLKYFLSKELWEFWIKHGLRSKLPSSEKSIWIQKSPVKDWYPSQNLPKSEFVYYIGPYREPYFTIYKKVIKPTIESMGLQCETAFEDPGSEEFLRQKILPNLKNARFVIADLSGNNVNVHYELGWLHAFGTPFLAFTSRNRPTDIQHLTINSYTMDLKGLKELAELIYNSILKNEISVTQSITELDYERIAEQLHSIEVEIKE